MTDIPIGLCQCGCGEKTTIAPKTRTECGWVKGQPIRYRKGHSPAVNRMKVRWLEDENGCWIWQGEIDENGYGRGHRKLARNSWQSDVAYRIVYMELVGPIPDELVLDHLCRVHACVNPAHLEPVTNRENIMRGDGAKLPDELLPSVYEQKMAGWSLRRIAASYGLGHTTIRMRLDDYVRENNLPEPPRLKGGYQHQRRAQAT